MYATYTAGNRLLDTLSGSDRSDLRNDLEIVTLPSRQWLAPYGGPRHHVDFPINAVISIVATMRNGDAVEVGTVGCEGFMETDAALESDTARRGSFCQISGNVARMTLDRFRERMDDSGSFARLMRRSVTATLLNAQQIAACHAKHRVEEQCARWLLMTRDRIGCDSFPLTHESLAILLGVRRASVSVAAQSLQACGAIVHYRGQVTIADAKKLQAASCECYADCTDAFDEALAVPVLAIGA
ncbi:MAG: Crp/Fnr family transcriptional regulator [Candidatus Eremiobacteraeota bacterium]|nr:Crp/Fnr family transcriptional regulator [Candidatus Eremiobacteraeota bacterium]